ncbi:uracil-DNA glycosylase family protein [Amphibiibacter pelophylacis]|uniref:Uracil-DNA glycosylase family protein n=1 Tax=Amphibiibacter pelophylacis TaxID=1799477 RepID=A0ACC6P1A9_9BURK
MSLATRDDPLLLDASAQAALGHMGLRWVELVQRTPAEPKAAPEPQAGAVTPVAAPAQAPASAAPTSPASPTSPTSPAQTTARAPRAPLQPAPPAAPALPPVRDAITLQPLGERPAQPVSQNAWQDCRECQRGARRQQALAGWGPWQADAPQPAPRLWLVLDAPSRQDDQRPDALLADARGALLDQFLRTLGWTRQDVALTWAVQCFDGSGADSAPDASALAACQPWLAGRVAAHRPAALLALGRQAALALVGGQAPLRDLRQRQHAVSLPGQDQPLPVIASFALDFLLGNPVFKGPAWYDWCSAAALAEESGPRTSQDDGA